MAFSIRLKNDIYNLDSPKVMGILNLTPDSFYSESRCIELDEEKLLQRIDKLLAEGLDILDIGACSTRPGSDAVSAEDEWKRLENPLRLIRAHFPELIISIDTYRASVIEKAANIGINIVNDISSGELDPDMLEVVAKLQLPYILCHCPRLPKEMQNNPFYEDVIKELILFFSQKIDICHKKGISDLIIDPGFGFGKTLDHNYCILANLDVFSSLDCPILVGMSRKSMLHRLLDGKAEDMLNATSCVNTLSLTKGANILRVHDVKEVKECIKIFERYKAF